MWLEQIKTTPDAPRINQKNGINSLSRMFKSSSQVSHWRNVVKYVERNKDFIQSRIALADRMTALLPKEATAWAKERVANGDFNAFGVLSRLEDQFEHLGQEIALTLPSTGPVLAARAMKLSDPDSMSMQDIASALIEQKQIKELITSFAVASMVGIYVDAMMAYWALVDGTMQIVPIPESPRPVEHPEDCECELCDEWLLIQDYIDDTDISMDIAGESAVKSKIWKEFSPTIENFSDVRGSDREAAMLAIADCSEALLRAIKDVRDAKKALEESGGETHKEKKRIQTELDKANSHVRHLTKQVEQMKASKGNQAEPIQEAPQPADSRTAEDLRLARKTIENQKAEIEQLKATAADMDRLVNSLMPNERPEQVGERTLSREDVLAKRGVVIGGHVNLTNKLRKEFKNNQFYSADAVTVDEPSFRNADYVLFFAGYLNHTLSDHALRLARQYGIPCAYTNKTNIGLIFEDVKGIFRG